MIAVDSGARLKQENEMKTMLRLIVITILALEPVGVLGTELTSLSPGRN